MKLKIIFILCILLSTSSVLTQNYLFVIDKQYPATPNWNFQLGKDDIGPRLDIKFAGNKNKGFLAFSTSTTSYLRQDSKINGNIYLFLEGGVTIILEEELYTDSYDDEIISVYSLNYSDMLSLSELNIIKIRFSIEESDILGFKSAKSYTAINKRPSLDLIGNYINNRVYVNESTEEREKRQKSYKKILDYFETSSDIKKLL